jgi:hypothetical protein
MPQRKHAVKWRRQKGRHHAVDVSANSEARYKSGIKARMLDGKQYFISRQEYDPPKRTTLCDAM